MAIEKNNFKVTRLDSELFMGSKSRESISSDEDGEHCRQSSMDSEDDDEFDDADSGAGSDDFDLLELGESGSEFCQVGDQACCIPFELYDLADLREVLSLDVWNECLTEEERFGLTRYLPDMDQETFMHTLKELFEGSNFHFGSPITKLFKMLKGGLCEPRVALYRQGLISFHRRQHYHLLRNYQDCMVSHLLQIRDAWQNCKGYSIEEKLRVLNIMRSQRSLMGEQMEHMEINSSERECSVEALQAKRWKGRNMEKKLGRGSVCRMSSASGFPSEKKSVAVVPTKYDKQNPKDLLKVVGSKTSSRKELAPHIYSHNQGLKSGSYGSALVLSKHGKRAAYDLRAPTPWMRDQMESEDDMEKMMYGISPRRDQNVSRSSVMDQGGSIKSGKKRRVFKGSEYVGDSYMDFPISSKKDLPAYGRIMNVNQLSDIKILTAKPSNMRNSYGNGKRADYLEAVCQSQMMSAKDRASQVLMKGNHHEFSDGLESYWSKRTPGEREFSDPSSQYHDWDARCLKLGMELHDPKLTSQRTSQQQKDTVYHPEKRTRAQGKIRSTSIQNGGMTMASLKGSRKFWRGEETESDSLDELDDEEDSNPLMMSTMTFRTGLMENSQPSLSKSGFDLKKDKLVMKYMESNQAVDVMPPTSRIMDSPSGHVQSLNMGKYSSKSRQKTKGRHVDHLKSDTSRYLEDSYFTGLSKSTIESDAKPIYKIDRNAQPLGELSENFPLSLLKASPAERRQKRAVGHALSANQDFFFEENANLFDAERYGLSAENVEANMKDKFDRSDAPLNGCNSVILKHKGKQGTSDMDRQDESDQLQSTQKQLNEHTSLKKRVKKKLEANRYSQDVETYDPPITETRMEEGELEMKPRKRPFTLITPTTHTGFSFSIVHLLSAVRVAMITPNPEDSLDAEKHLENTNDQRPDIVEDQNGKHQRMIGSQGNLDVNNEAQVSMPSLTVQEIVCRVRSNPGDPCILETQEPLQDLVRGVLKIFSSKTAPLGTKGWKPLVYYDKYSKSWSWVGPVAQSPSDHETLEEVTSPEAWGISHKMLVKLVDSFASWLKSGQETLQQIGSLPAPPVELMQVALDEKERFRDLRAQKSLTTISPSSEVVRAYFRKEEQLRYSVPDRAFSYTAADGKKSIVAPLRRGGGKPAAKARDHPMLKRERPPHVTILCLVRDAAARLPGSVGTRADVCALIRDSQYIVEDISDAQVNQVVSGALDRLHYERDPCVQFDGERKLWVYLHRKREEEDFEDDGTSSTKKWKRQKKDANEQDDQGIVTVNHESGEQTGFDLSADLNVEPSCTNNDDRMEVTYDDTRQNAEDNAKTNLLPAHGPTDQSHPMLWEALGLEHMSDNKLFCQQNSTNEDFDDDTFVGGQHVGVLGAS
ncbi:hypothetical protein Nepgr_000057 [Nepenthes gracilis]|uniref:DEUBAD domain-containing protein n=1 Tax=Nepenthes gracilis TaxID=150966 RepID=A0AAD3RWH3_NEPGR|nr:hypothetical protein Nepgr_000057 [Nepenthes gracilis]